MRKNEKQLFFELCKFQNPDIKKIEELIAKGAATPEVLGHLFYNRMEGIAYGVLLKNKLLGGINREFRNSLKNSNLQNKQKNDSFLKCIEQLNEILGKSKVRYALLKGAYLCNWYPQGYRTSNDVDILLNAKDITKLSHHLIEHGFKQGNIKNDEFIPATREEIIGSKMMRGETVPYIKEVNLPLMKFFEVDLNYSISYKNEKDSIVEEFVLNAEEIILKNQKIVTLDKYDFVIHLCEHLYKEATTYPWVEMKRDMTLYKFCDIYALLYSYTKKDYKNLQKRVKTLEREISCYYAIAIMKRLFSVNDIKLEDFLKEIKTKVQDVLSIVINPQDKKIYQYKDTDIMERFFAKNRKNLLKEVQINEKT